nr:hypothetical protein [uncultured Rhodopila sp.]
MVHHAGRAGVVLAAVLAVSIGRLVEAQTAAPSLGRLAGSYHSLAEHPRVFTTQSELRELADRIAVRNSYSSLRFGQLAGRIALDLAAGKAWDKAYSGCNIETYLYAFSHEPQDAAQSARVGSDLRLGPQAKPPAGAAVVASRLALYAALARAGAPLPAKAPDPGRAADLAKRILMAWGDHGFRDEAGRFLFSAGQFCGLEGKVDAGSMTQVGLQVSRGVVYSAHAQDLLMYLGTLDADEARHSNDFHGAMFDLIRNALNYRFVDHADWACNHYSNHVGSQLTGLLAVARLLDDESRFSAVVYGGNPSMPVALPWNAYFDKAIYGIGAHPNECYNNTGFSGLTSRPFFQTATTTPGEINDRYRNANPYQGFGYSMGTLEWLYDIAEILRHAGFDAYAFRGSYGQSIEMATEYYACYATAVGFGNAIVAQKAAACPNFEQYAGKIISGAEGIFMRSAIHYPGDSRMSRLEELAKMSALSANSGPDAVLFGQWRN